MFVIFVMRRASRLGGWLPSLPLGLLLGLVAVFTVPATAQDAFLAPGDVDVDFLFNYYDQDGDRSPVTGGIGTEDMQVSSSVFLLRHRVGDDWQMSYQLGVDSISSASVDAIDFQVSSASQQDTRAYTLITGTRKLGETGRHALRLSGGYSGEYDYQSASLGVGWSGDFRNGNTTLSLDLRHYADTVELYDIDGIDQGDADRDTTDVTFGWTQILGPGSLLSAELFLSEGSGFLSTVFHEVILSDLGSGGEPLHFAESLPDSRSRTALGLSYHHAFSKRFVLRSHYRYYDDDWGIQAQTVSLEPNFRLPGRHSTWVFPILRWHDQSGADAWGPPGTFSAADPYYTADPDLGEFVSEKVGFGFRSSFDRTGVQGWRRLWRSVEARVASYSRDDGFEALTASFGFGWRF